MYFLSVDEPKIATNTNETFAMIVVRDEKHNLLKERVWIFTESDGFKEMADLENFCCYTSRDNVLMIRIK